MRGEWNTRIFSLGAFAANDALACRFLAHPRVFTGRDIMTSFIAASRKWLESESAQLSAAEIGATWGS